MAVLSERIDERDDERDDARCARPLFEGGVGRRSRWRVNNGREVGRDPVPISVLDLHALDHLRPSAHQAGGDYGCYSHWLNIV